MPISLPVITWNAMFTIRPKCQQRTAIFAECEVSLSRFLLRHRLYCRSDRPILYVNLIEFDGEKCLYSRSFRFYKHFDVCEKKTWDALHTKNMFAAFPLFIANAVKIQKYIIEWFSETEKLLLLTLWQRPQEHFNRHPLLWHPYTITFDVIPYTLKTIEMYFPGLIEHIRVCGPRWSFSFVIRFATKSVLQNIHALVVIIYTPPLSNKRLEAHSQDKLYYIAEWSHY